MNDRITQTKADILKALAHPTRLNILESLRDGERCVCEIIDDVNIEQSNVSQHLAVLKKLDIVSSRKDGLRVIYQVKHEEIFKILSLLDSFISRQMEETMAMLDGLKQKRAVSN
ncbi:MAG: metalloregulator ArsR/SmtB family transcription factor [Firmicutes bacterium]|nr:metalloregulator ArsR/SmtB family transcription factor [Bacillota bacterium]